MRNFIFLILLLVSNIASADIFVVTSPTDASTPGTLRWAIESANANPVANGVDHINFNIPSGNPLFRVIQLNSELPALTSNIIIDGTTQLMGTAYGPTDAKIIITPKLFLTCKRGLVIRDARNIEIYGLYFAGFISKTPTTPELWSDGIFICNSTNITIGAPARGNAFALNYHSIRNEGLLETGGPFPTAISSNIKIQNNSIGRNYTPATPTPPLDGTVCGVELFGVHDVLIGGYDATEKNDFRFFLDAVRISLAAPADGASASINVINNSFRPGTFAAPPPFTLTVTDIQIVAAANTGNQFVNISHNVINTCSKAISLVGLKHPFSIENNSINVNLVANGSTPTTAISVNNCDSGNIGQKDSANIIHDAFDNGIALTATKFVRINHNSIYCNSKGIKILIPAVTIPKITELVADPATALTGKTCSRCIVEIFSTDECAAQIYNGKTLIGTSVADAAGNWAYRGPVDCNTSYTVTEPNKATSEFYTGSSFIFDTTALIKKDASCGQNNGSIKGIKIFAGVDFHWEDNAGNTISIDTNLVNLAPGFYKLVCNKQNIGCRPPPVVFEIKGITPVVNSGLAQLVHPSSDCRAKGSINGIIVSGGISTAFGYQWTNQSGAIVGITLGLNNVDAGTYTLAVSVISDPTCFVTAGPFTLIDKPAPKFDDAAIQITSASCGQNTGSIRGMAILNAYPNPQYIWHDATGNPVGNGIDLGNVPPGSYYLEYDDASACPPIISPSYIIGNNGLVTVDETNKIIEAAGCTIIKGAIKNISVTGANQYEWIDMATGAFVGNTIDLLNVPSGNYKLRAYDTNFGCADSTEILFVPLTALIPLNVQNKLVKDETCTASNGSIANIVFQPAAVGYNFKWVKNNIDTFSSALNINNLSKADYTLLGYDSNGCMQTVIQETLADHPSPVIDESSISIVNDTCTQKIGAIKNINSSGGDSPFQYLWYNSAGNTIAGSGKELKNIGAGNYYMIVADKNNCRDTSTVLVAGNESISPAPPRYEIIYTKRNTAAFLKNLNPLPGTFYLYDSPSGGIPLQSNNSGTFRTQALAGDKDFWIDRSVGSCSSNRVQIRVNVIDYSKIFIPNAFTPNNDGRNDVLNIKVYGKIIIDYFIIYNRWGQQLFITSNINQGWDGTYKGKLQPSGTYAWVVHGNDIDGSPVHLKGTVTILK